MSKHGRVVMFDMDGVLADFLGGFSALAKTFYPAAPLLTYDQADPVRGIYQQERWDFDPQLIPPAIVEKVWQTIKAPDSLFWINLEPLQHQDIYDWISDMARERNVYFVTSRPGAWAKPQTESWLRARGVENPTVIISSLKGEVAKSLEADYSIEDKAGNAVMIKYWSPKTHSYILDWPYNRFNQDILGSKVRRVDGVGQFLEDVEKRA